MAGTPRWPPYPHEEPTHGDHRATFRSRSRQRSHGGQDRRILSYITIIGFIAAIFMHQNHKTRLGAFHLRQMLGMVLTSAAGAVCGFVPILG